MSRRIIIIAGVVILLLAVVVCERYYFFAQRRADVYTSHYHHAERWGGNTYLIIRPGGESSYQTDPNWTDELWRFNRWGWGKKLLANRGLDFRVSADEQMIAIIASGENEITGENLILLDRRGISLKTFDANQLGLDSIEPLKWSGTSFWLGGGSGAGIQTIIKIDSQTFQWEKFDVTSLTLTNGEFDLEPETQQIAFSDYPLIFDEDGLREYEQRRALVTLAVYDLQSNNKRELATAITKAFRPKWLDQRTLEYNDPESEKRITKTIYENPRD